MSSAYRGALLATVLCSLLALQVPGTEAFVNSMVFRSSLALPRSAKACPCRRGVATGLQMREDSGVRLQRRDAVRAGWLLGTLLGTATLLANPQGASAKDAEREKKLKLVVAHLQ